MFYAPIPEGTGYLSQGFGARPQYYKKYGHKGHNGYDWAPNVRNQQGVVVYAPHSGFCKLFYGDKGYGNYVELLSEPMGPERKRYKSDVAHFERFLVQPGQFVQVGDPIGVMGSTGDSTAVHVHWTPKLADENGQTIGKNNGFNGAIRVGRYTRKWLIHTVE